MTYQHLKAEYKQMNRERNETSDYSQLVEKIKQENANLDQMQLDGNPYQGK